MENEGDCDNHDECQDNLFCGEGNCKAHLNFDSHIDCCYQPTLGDEHFCTSGSPCGENEGDCDSDSECQENHICGSNNCLASLELFYPEGDCCTQIMSPNNPNQAPNNAEVTNEIQLMSPNYPNPYPSNAEETWLLTDPSASIITLKFQSFEVRNIILKYCT